MTTAPTHSEIKTDSDAVGIRSSALFGTVITATARKASHEYAPVLSFADGREIVLACRYATMSAARYDSLDMLWHMERWPNDYRHCIPSLPNDSVEMREPRAARRGNGKEPTQ